MGVSGLGKLATFTVLNFFAVHAVMWLLERWIEAVIWLNNHNAGL